MTLRAKLVISFTVLLLVVIAAVGLVASRAVDTILTGQIDSTLIGFANRGPVGFGPPPPGADEPFLSPIAEILIAEDGTVVVARPSGFADDSDPLPDVGEIKGIEGLTYLDSVDNTVKYRAHITEFPDGSMAVRAAPLDDVSAATSSLVRTLAIAAAGVMLVGGAATWWTVDRSMSPVSEMVDTAEAIASGDLTRRVPETDPESELGRLGDSLNGMLAHIEKAVTDERDGRERLRRFVADASHELRTPVAAIRGYAELRRKGGLPLPDAEDRAWSRIEFESSRMGSLIEDLIMLARLGQSHPLSVEITNLDEIAADAAADHATIDADRPIEVDAPDSVVMKGDKQRLHQVVSSLLDNVRVHTPEGTLVKVEVRNEGAWAILTVVDDGPGIPPHAVNHVFDRFYRADPSRSRRSGGSGLGLSIVQAIVEAHGGTVDATNDAGGGARFTVRVPKASQSQPALPGRRTSVSAPADQSSMMASDHANSAFARHSAIAKRHY